MYCYFSDSEDEILEYSEDEEETLDALPDNLDVKDEAQLSRLSGELYHEPRYHEPRQWFIIGIDWKFTKTL